MFETEKALVETFKEMAPSFLGEFHRKKVKDFFLLEEYESHDGIADLVLGTFRASAKNQSPRRAISLNWVQHLSNISHLTSISIDGFSSHFAISRSTSRKRLLEFAESGFLTPTSKDTFKVLKRYRPVLETVISIEAKLKKWNYAIKQAYRYKKFSDYAYVLLDKKYSSPAIKEKLLFTKLNIGLIVMNESKYEVVFKPRRKNQKHEIYFNRLNEAALFSSFG